jgi:hypothetical protein
MMTLGDVFAELSTEQSVPPRFALAAADGQREAHVDPLLRVIERGLADPPGCLRSVRHMNQVFIVPPCRPTGTRAVN